jgi:hypothetical protein
MTPLIIGLGVVNLDERTLDVRPTAGSIRLDALTGH